MTCRGTIKFFDRAGEIIGETAYKSKSDRTAIIKRMSKPSCGCLYYQIYPQRFKRHYVLEPDTTPVVIQRPAAVYSNTTPYGIAKSNP